MLEHGKIFSQKILMWNIKALALTFQKILARLKFERGQNDRQEKKMHPDLRTWGHKIFPTTCIYTSIYNNKFKTEKLYINWNLFLVKQKINKTIHISCDVL